MASNGSKRPASDSDEFEPSKLDKKKAKKLDKYPNPQVFKGRHSDPDLTDSDVEGEGDMEVVQQADFDDAPFLIDVTDDMSKFWPMESHVLDALQKFYSGLEIRISKSSKGQTLIHPLSQEAVHVPFLGSQFPSCRWMRGCFY